MTGGKEDPGEDLGSGATLTDLRVRGDTADAVLELANGKTMPLHFTKTAGGWRISLPDRLFAKLLEGDGRIILGQVVAGTITLDGKPVHQGEIWFHPERAKPVRILVMSGTYNAQLAPRAYRVTVHPRTPSLTMHLLPYLEDDKLPKDFDTRIPVVIPEQYTDPGTSRLTLELRPGRGPVRRDFDLKSR
jgi:hypothetical protein